MRWISYLRDGERRHGRLTDDRGGVIESGPGDLLGALEGEGLAATAARPGPTYSLDEVEIAAPLVRPPKLLAVAANYGDHVRESGGTPMRPDRAVPRLFLKPSTAILGPQDRLTLPTVSSAVDWEVELAVVIGKRCRHVSESDALGVVAGYLTANDISARSLDFPVDRAEEHKAPFFDWLMGKWADGFAPLGPWLVTADEVPDPQQLELHLSVNGRVRQQGSTADMIFGVTELIAFASSFMTLEPGDIIETGTPAGVGAATKEFLQPGDIMVARVGDLGEQRTEIVPPVAS